MHRNKFRETNKSVSIFQKDFFDDSDDSGKLPEKESTADKSPKEKASDFFDNHEHKTYIAPISKTHDSGSSVDGETSSGTISGWTSYSRTKKRGSTMNQRQNYSRDKPMHSTAPHPSKPPVLASKMRTFVFGDETNTSEPEEDEEKSKTHGIELEKIYGGGDTDVHEAEDSEEMDEIEESEKFKFENKWNLWIHETETKDWSHSSYKLMYTISNIKEFWDLVSNLHLLDHWKYNFFLMKSNSYPTWEHPTNRHGGTCSMRIDVSQSIELLEQLLLLTVNESLVDELEEINGISFGAKGNWSVVKIWNRDNKNNITSQMPTYLRRIYPSISIKYKENTPEY